MLKKLFLMLALAAAARVAMAQLNAPSRTTDTLLLVKADTLFKVKRHQMKLSFDQLGLVLGYQKGLDSLNALRADVGFIPNTLYGGNFDFNQGQFFGPSFSMNALVSIGYRHYYHFKARRAKHKITNYNASNYVFIDLGCLSKPVLSASYPKPEALMFAKFGWGLQRNWGKHFNYELQLGAMLVDDVRHKPFDPYVYIPDITTTAPNGTPRSYDYRRNSAIMPLPVVNFSVGYRIF